jgi:hypothetical protein
MAQHQPEQKMQDPFQETTKAKQGLGVAQVVEHLPSKCKTLSSNTTNPPKKNLQKILNDEKGSLTLVSLVYIFFFY